MKKFCIWTVVMFFLVQNISADYCTRTTNSNSSRYLSSISFQGGIYEFTPLTIATSGYSAIYYNKTAKVFSANAGATITPQINYEGSWMQGYVYVDYNSDGTFNTSDELVAYSGYMQNGKWINSKGEQLSDGGVCPPSTVPSFIIPESIPSGDYRMRIKVDWDSSDPCGRTSATGNSMEQNGGAIVDMTLRITGITRNYVITIENEYTKDYVLDWEDEFNDRRLDESVWSRIEPYESGNPDWRKNISTYDGCFDIRDGNMVLRGIKNPGESITGDTRTYLCGGIESWGKKSFKNGRVEIRAKTTSAQGAWPALWMMPEDQSAGWPGCGEIDIFEHLNYDSFVYQTLHSNYTYNVSKESPLSHITEWVDVSNYNTYGVELSSDTIKLLVNDNVTMAYPNTGATDQFPYSKEFYLILDMQLGGSWVGSVTGVDLPVEMSLDWVRFYKRYETGGRLMVKTLANKIISSGESVPENSVLMITATPVDGYEVETIIVNGVDVTAEHNVSGTYAYSPTSSTTISATYKPKSTSVKDVEYNDVVVYAANNRIVIVSPKAVDATIFNISGMVVDSRVVEGREEIEKPSGIYIVKVGGDVFKVKL
ncbi:MAG: glycoside hydrolase family 16 protein [Muribaculaceae bacterium]|nr:glycoside hydrolase family 16 protein [Muribaculaceae bacterium]